MISRLFLIGFFLLISFSCDKSERVVITGIVTDEVTGNPVAGASVSLKLDFIYDGQHFSRIIQGTTTNTASDGSYKIVYDSGHPEIGSINYDKTFPDSFYAGASAPGYAGSDLYSLTAYNTRNADIKLYHYAQLNLHIKNISNLDGCCIWLDTETEDHAYFENADFSFSCKGKNFDSTIVIKNTWGNIKYLYTVGNSGGYCGYYMDLNGYNNILSGYIIPKPDSITDFFINF